MSAGKHTPGPWSYSTSPEGWSYNIHQADDAPFTPEYSDVAFSTCTGERKEIQEANARLIAAAPELLEALQALFKWTPIRTPVADTIVGAQVEHERAIKRARAAIVKATGEAQ